MFDPEALVQEGMQGAKGPMAGRQIIHNHVTTHGILSRRQCPDVQVMHCANARNHGHRCIDLTNIQVWWYTLHQDMQGLMHQGPGPWQDEKSDRRAAQWVNE